MTKVMKTMIEAGLNLGRWSKQDSLGLAVRAVKPVKATIVRLTCGRLGGKIGKMLIMSNLRKNLSFVSPGESKQVQPVSMCVTLTWAGRTGANRAF